MQNFRQKFNKNLVKTVLLVSTIFMLCINNIRAGVILSPYEEMQHFHGLVINTDSTINQSVLQKAINVVRSMTIKQEEKKAVLPVALTLLGTVYDNFRQRDVRTISIKEVKLVLEAFDQTWFLGKKLMLTLF